VKLRLVAALALVCLVPSPSCPAVALGRERVRIYQMFVRLFGSVNETRKANGTLAENGAGKFNDINDAALSNLRAMGFTHVWLTGVLQQATGTDYSSIGKPADDPDLLKGIAGSPYAIRDYYDVCPDYAVTPEKRLDEFKQLLTRIHQHQLRALIDFVPNHVARSYGSVVRPELDFGRDDDKSRFFDPRNNFFYLHPGNGGPPLHFPTVKDGRPVSATCKLPGMPCDGLFPSEQKYGRVTGNNKVSWSPSLDDWYETVKLNYGFDFTVAGKDVREYPNANAPDKPLPDTWKKMDQVLAYWQSFGVDGFRCDMAHMVPPEFWSWAISQARARNRDTMFVAEAYEDDPARVPAATSSGENVTVTLLKCGFNAVYDDRAYKTMKKIYDGGGWANDIDHCAANGLVSDRSLRYAENHDEVRLAAAHQWAGAGMKAGPAICAVLYGLSAGPVMLYNGQEVGEPAAGAEGFGGDDGRTSIFDYWSMPELVKWVDKHKYDGAGLSTAQKELRERYSTLLHAIDIPAFRQGTFVPLNGFNHDNPEYGRLAGEQVSGHWLYCFARVDYASRSAIVAAVNLHSTQAMLNVKILLPEPLRVIRPWGKAKGNDLDDSLASNSSEVAGHFSRGAIMIEKLPALTARYFQFRLPD